MLISTTGIWVWWELLLHQFNKNIKKSNLSLPNLKNKKKISKIPYNINFYFSNLCKFLIKIIASLF